MATKTIPWPTGTGSVTATYTGSGNGSIVISSDPNNLSQSRSMQITIGTTDGSNIQRTVIVTQAAKVSTPNFILSDGKYLLLSDGKYFNVKE